MFHTYVLNHFSTKILTIRSDNALEFCDKACVQYYAKEGIIYQTCCAYRPQQNARVERKHMHILEMTRVLKFQSGFSNSYWGDCVLTAAYIINRLPSDVLQHQLPYEVLSKTPVD